MTDLIDRQAAIDSMCELMHHWFGCDSKDEIREIKRELGKLPSAEPEQRWIPVTERVPEDDRKEYLITVLDNEDGVSEVYKGFYQDDEWWTQWCHGCKRVSEETCGDNVVTAWMELPKAFEAKWIDVVNSHCKCPCCGDEWSYFENETERFKYCPNCGTELGEDLCPDCQGRR